MKEHYEAPEVQVLEMELQSIIAMSGEGFSNPDVDNTDI